MPPCCSLRLVNLQADMQFALIRGGLEAPRVAAEVSCWPAALPLGQIRAPKHRLMSHGASPVCRVL